MAEYRIQEKTLTAIADRTREMAGTGNKMTPAEIIYWLGRVKFIPQGWANSELALKFDTAAVSRLPTVVRSTANSTLTLNFKISAVGALSE